MCVCIYIYIYRVPAPLVPFAGPRAWADQYRLALASLRLHQLPNGVRTNDFLQKCRNIP